MEPLFHLTTPDTWADAVANGAYPWSTRGKRFAEVGFVHCSTWAQIEGVARYVYPGELTLTLLVIDPSLVAADIRYENLDGGSELFPHIYGELPMAAVVRAITLHANTAGQFWLPDPAAIRRPSRS